MYNPYEKLNIENLNISDDPVFQHHFRNTHDKNYVLFKIVTIGSSCVGKFFIVKSQKYIKK